MHRNLAATAKLSKHCLEAGKNLKPDIVKSNLGEPYVPTEPNEVVQLDFLGSVNYVQVRKNYALIVFDKFLHWSWASVSSSDNSRNFLKLLKNYKATYEHPRKLHMDQTSGFFSKKTKNFCKTENIELVKSPVGDHRATGMVERNIGSLKNYVMTYLKEKGNRD